MVACRQYGCIYPQQKLVPGFKAHMLGIYAPRSLVGGRMYLKTMSVLKWRSMGKGKKKIVLYMCLTFEDLGFKVWSFI